MQSCENMKLIDANVMLRYLMNDHPEMSREAKAVIEHGAYTKPEIIAEVIYVLKGVYHVTRVDIGIYIKCLLRSVHCAEAETVVCAVNLFSESSLDFIDCLLVAYHRMGGEKVFTFDKKLNKYLNAM